MNIDTVSLVVKSVTDKMVNGLKSAIGVWKNYDSEINKVSNTLNKVANSTNGISSSFKDSKEQVASLENELKSLTKEYEKQSKLFKSRPTGLSKVGYDPTVDTSKGETYNPEKSTYTIISQNSLDKQKEKIEQLRLLINQLKTDAKSEDTDIIKPPELNAFETMGEKLKKIKDYFKQLKEESAEPEDNIDALLDSISRLEKGFNKIKRAASNFFKSFSKNIDGNFGKIKKLALGLVGVRTAMSVLTKSVGAYLSFDSELQDSLTNSWNMLGSLLAPAIELVANLFAMATNNIAYFVQALTGIDLVARANAKSLETQAKAQAKANNAQRGLLGMDEITNLPTESGGNPAAQITKGGIQANSVLNDLLKALKNQQWHIAGELIGQSINNALRNINWSEIHSTVNMIGYNIADFLNGAFELDWTLLGSTIGNGLNTALEFAFGFVEKFSFIQLGVGLGRSFNSLFKTIDWAKLGITISDGIVGIFNSITMFLETANWTQIGESILLFLQNIQWGEIANAVFEAIISAFSGIDDLLTSIFGDSTATTIEVIIGAVVALKVALAALSVVMGIVSLAETGMLVPILLVTAAITAIIAVVILLAKHFNDMKDIAISVFNAIAIIFEHVAKSIANVFIMILNVAVDAINGILSPFRMLIVAYGKVTGKHWTMDNIKIPNVPYLQTGTNDIESEGLYHLHEGEAVVPKKYNPATGGYDNSADNKKIIDLLISLNSNFIDYSERPTIVNLDGREVAEGIYDDLQQIDKNNNKSDIVTRS